MKKGVLIESKIKAVIFDMGGVLRIGKNSRKNKSINHISGIHESIAKRLKINIDQYFDSIDTAYAKSMEGKISENILLDTLSFNLNYPREKIKKLYVEGYRKLFKKNIWLFGVAKQLKKKSFKIAILSDQWHLSKDALMPKKDVKIFDEAIASCDVGIRKPSRKSYEFILEKLGIKPSEALFIDNQVWNIVPANKMGMKTILYQDNKKIKEQFAKYGIYIKWIKMNS